MLYRNDHKYLAIAVLTLNLSCGNGSESQGDQPEQVVEKPEQSEEVAPESPPKAEAKAEGKEAINLISTFLHTEVAPQQSARIDSGQVLLVSPDGGVAVAGITRSRLKRDVPSDPSFAGDLFFAKYEQKSGWSKKSIAAQIKLPPPPPVAPPADGEAAAQPIAPEDPKPLDYAAARVRGGRLYPTGKAYVVGELDNTQFQQSQLNLEETEPAAKNVFLSIFGANENGIFKSIRYGLTGDNTVVGSVSANEDGSLIITGQTETGLLKDGADRVSTLTPVNSNYLATLDDQGSIQRFVAWPTAKASEATQIVTAITRNDEYVFVAAERPTEKRVFVRGVRTPNKRQHFIPLPEKEVCANAVIGATDAKVVSMDAHATEIVVAVEITKPTVGGGIVLPCIEIFDIKSSGAIAAKRELVNMDDSPTLQNSTKIKFTKDNKLLVVRSRENTDSSGKVGIVVSFVYDRPLQNVEYHSKLWNLSRPQDWYEGSGVDGLYRNVKDIAWVPGDANDLVWILSDDVTKKENGNESLVHLGTYQTSVGDPK